jgi:hypothetical protein
MTVCGSYLFMTSMYFFTPGSSESASGKTEPKTYPSAASPASLRKLGSGVT